MNVVAKLVSAYILLNLFRYMCILGPLRRFYVDKYIIPLIYKFNGIVILGKNEVNDLIKVSGQISYGLLDKNNSKIETKEISGAISDKLLNKENSLIEVKQRTPLQAAGHVRAGHQLLEF